MLRINVLLQAKDTQHKNKKGNNMIRTITQSDFVNAFDQRGRGKSWSLRGLEALYDFLEDVDPNYDLDVVALDCQYSDFNAMGDLQNDYEHLFDEDEEYDDEEIIDTLSNHTTVIRYDGGVVIDTNF
jgi:hypothetical protein